MGPDGRDSPNEVGPFLVWQQPHLLFFAELLYRVHPTGALVDDLVELVEETARFMASFAEERDGVFHLAPPLVPAQESYDRHATEDPTFELAYWWWGLEIAQRWRERRGIARDGRWAHVQEHLALPCQEGGTYAAIATEPHLRREDHPSMLGALGVVPPTPMIDREVMRATLDDVLENWDWDSAWGWDFPVLAMTATRVGDPRTAVDALLMDKPKNEYLRNGHNPQRGNRLPVYLPGNGGLLAAVSLMVGGWDGADGPAPGFPKDGTWDVRFRGLCALALRVSPRVVFVRSSAPSRPDPTLKTPTDRGLTERTGCSKRERRAQARTRRAGACALGPALRRGGARPRSVPGGVAAVRLR